MKDCDDFFQTLIAKGIDRAVVTEDGRVTVKNNKKWEKFADLPMVGSTLFRQLEKNASVESKVFKNAHSQFVGYPTRSANGSLLFLKTNKSAYSDLKIWNLPSLFTRSFVAKKGLSVISGPKESGKTSLVFGLLQELLGQNLFVTLVSEEWSLFSKESVFLRTFTKISDVDMGALKLSDAIVIDTNSPESLNFAIQLAKQGFSVVVTSLQPEFCMFDRHLRYRDDYEEVVGLLSTFIAPRIVIGLQQEMVSLFELIALTPEIKRGLVVHDSEALFPIQNHLDEQTGSRTLNQSLFQLLVQRKIDLKTGYENSEYPDELDKMMKKVGL